MSGEADNIIRAQRMSLGLSQMDVASLFGVQSVTVAMWERGVACPSTWQLSMWAAVVGAGRCRARRAVDVLRSGGLTSEAWRIVFSEDEEVDGDGRRVVTGRVIVGVEDGMVLLSVDWGKVPDGVTGATLSLDPGRAVSLANALERTAFRAQGWN